MMPTGDFAKLATWVVPGAYALGGLALGIAVRSWVVPVLARIAARSPWKYDDALVVAIRNPLVVWFTLLGLHVAGELLPFEQATHATLHTVVAALVILSLTWAAARFAYLAVVAATRTPATPHGVSLIGNLARLAIGALGLLVLLDTAGIRITSIITAFGIGGLAVGLALQDTLANFFAGIRILVAQKIRPGDFVKLENGLEGTVHDITWGQTTILQGPGNLVIVPNSKLATAITTNYSLPEPAQNFTVSITVAVKNDLAKVEAVTMQVALEVLREIEAAAGDFNPLVRFDGFGETGVTLHVVLRSRSYESRGQIISEFVKRLHPRYAAEGIEIPVPIRTVHITGGGPAA